MACFPKIDQPCPLGIDAQRRIAGFCGHCSKAVHGLDAMSDAERVAFMRNAQGPICVSFRVRRGAAIGLGVALALSASVPGHADPVGPELQAAVESVAATTTPPPPPPEPPVMLMGGVSDPQSVAFVEDDDDDDVPELPIVHEAGAR